MECNREIIAALYVRCRKKATRWARSISVAFTGLLALGFISSMFTGVPASVAIGGLVVLVVMTGLNLVWGETVRGVHDRLRRRLLDRLMRRESKIIGIDLTRDEIGTWRR